MDYTYNKIWGIEHKLVVSKNIDDAITRYKSWTDIHTGIVTSKYKL